MTEIKAPVLVCPSAAIVNEMIECKATIPQGSDMTATIDFGDGSNVRTTSVAGMIPINLQISFNTEMCN